MADFPISASRPCAKHELPVVIGTTVKAPAARRNAFQQTLLGLDYTPGPDGLADLFSQACVDQYRAADLTRYGYLFPQVFEPDVLREVALLEAVPYASLQDLDHRPTAAMTRLAALVQAACELPVVGLVNVAAALISVSRFEPAARLLTSAAHRAADARDAFEVAMLEFVVSNRCEDGAGSRRAFQVMRRAVETGPLPGDRVIDACSQAVVWYLKRREPSEADFHWFLAAGRELAREPDRLDPASVSSWYRALAMVPAAGGEAATTRRYMQQARAAAEETLSRRPRAYERFLLKTYHESTLKEHLHLTRDLDRAQEAGRALIELDPAWSPSYGELAEVAQKLGQAEEAAGLYERAAETGPPYVGHHLLRAARCREALGQDERALDHYLSLCWLAPDSAPLLTAGLDLARRTGHESRASLEAALARLGA